MDTYAPTKKTIQLLPIALLFLVSGCSRPPGISLEEVGEFGSNPGELRMFKYVPASLEAGSTTESASTFNGQDSGLKVHKLSVPGAPLVVALHGCLQDAHGYGEDSGWAQLADQWGFLLLLPEQQRGNNLTRCFNWYSPDDYERDKGEAMSIRQMIDQMRRDHGVDPQRIFVTGVSAGAAMTLALAAAYPDTFAGAAPVAGIAFGCADGLFAALSCMRDPPDKAPTEWGSAVRSASSYEGPWPRISVWQGEADSAVNPANAGAIVSQWTDVHGIEDTPIQVDEAKGHAHSIYLDAIGRTLVEIHRIDGMGHGLPVDPGLDENQCGKAGRFFPDVDICSSRWIGRFWGLRH